MSNTDIKNYYGQQASNEEKRLPKRQPGKHVYRVALGNNQQIYRREDVTCKSPREALYEVLRKLYDPSIYSIEFNELKHKLDIARIANAKVEKLTGMKVSVHYYQFNIDTLENKRARREAQLEIENAERRGHYQNIV